MKCEQIGELLPDFLQGNLDEEQNEIVELHTAQCADCRDEVSIWKKLGQLPVAQPSAASRARFEAMLHAYQTGRSDRVSARFGRAGRAAGSNIFQWLRTPVGAVAWSAALLVIGIFAGNYFGNRPAHPIANQDEIAAMHSDLINLRQLLALSMLQQQSASERLQGVSWSQREEYLDPQVMAALLHTLRFDGSVDVRLAALNALSRHAGQPQVHKGVLDALQEQQSPLVQVALIDLLTEWHKKEAWQRLSNIEQKSILNPTVKQRTEWAVSKLN